MTQDEKNDDCSSTKLQSQKKILYEILKLFNLEAKYSDMNV